MIVGSPDALDRTAIEGVADGEPVELSSELLADLDRNRAGMLAALEGSGPVYGVTTGMGAMAGIALDARARAAHQDHLVRGRAVGSAPWLSHRQARAVLAVRLRTFLHPEAAVSAELCAHLADLLNRGIVPKVPLRGNGAAGEIIPLAHAGAVVLGGSETLDGRAGTPFSFGLKEGVAFLEGVPVATALALLHATETGELLARAEELLALSSEVLRASPHPVDARTVRGDEVLAGVQRRVRELRPTPGVQGLQAPVSVRVAPAAIALARRRVDALTGAVDRALSGVSDSPAFVDGEFLGTAGFAGTELAAGGDGLGAALLHLAETSVARTHRMLDARQTGLNPQLSPEPGVQAGLVALHKRAVGAVHRLRRFTLPSLSGAMETSLGQEDVQSFGLEAAECLQEVLAGTREALAIELLAVHRAALLRGGLSGLSPVATTTLDGVRAAIGDDLDDRPYGRDVEAVTGLLRTAGVSRPG